MRGRFYFGSLQLYAATTLKGFCRLAAHQDPEEGVTQITKGSDAPAVVDGASLAYLVHVKTRHGKSPSEWESQWVVHAFGEQGPQLAEQVAGMVRAWDRDVRTEDGNGADPALTVHPAGTPDHLLPAGDVLDKASSRLVFTWPGRNGHLPAPPRGPPTRSPRPRRTHDHLAERPVRRREDDPRRRTAPRSARRDDR
ncbi:hypothetical protein [Streptomyces sp. NPDC090029]|uniref:hypothetical protein n=1 Tax=Streptomyces sp. NPDC090029 TaxID=3365924 RepID=UPI0037F887A4